MEIEVLSDKQNILVNRREVSCIFKGDFGHISRQEAVKNISKTLNTQSQKVYLISLNGRSGTRDATGLFYIYENEKDATNDIPKYLLKRNTTKESKEAESKDKAETASAKPAEKAKKPKS